MVPRASCFALNLFIEYQLRRLSFILFFLVLNLSQSLVCRSVNAGFNFYRVDVCLELVLFFS